ncbi:hypothetical protein [Pseudomonas sp. PDM04]|jgi:hypothetical protein|uniref:hypothetical protein n=1 Tax=Pseudomonas sp. PDM04 TaxID=2769296 RepID=UPI00177B675A|nr:hypothetical protein [Pseudomonas sp. PDM04]MBD9443112.1 hypothetical protein [Pseudomonas sp. PDM04]
MEPLVTTLTSATLLAALVGGIFGGLKLWLEDSRRKAATQAALFAELVHIQRHYDITAQELGNPSNNAPIRRQLRWALYGNSIGAANIKENAILGANEMARFLQLAFFIRNTDILINELLTDQEDPPTAQLTILADRLRFGADLADYLITYMTHKRRSLAIASKRGFQPVRRSRPDTTNNT